MLRLTRLKIHRFRHVSPGTDLTFGDTFNVLLGKNGTGKTTLLKIIAAILADDLSEFDDDDSGYHLEYQMNAVDLARIQVEVNQPAPTRTLENSARSARQHARGSVRLMKGELDQTWAVDGLRAHLGTNTLELEARPNDAGFRARFENARKGTSVALFIPGPFSWGAKAGRLDESVEALQRFIDGTVVVDEDDGQLWGSSFATALNTSKMTVDGDSVEISSTDSPLLKEAASVLGFAKAKARLTVSTATSTIREFNQPQLTFSRADRSSARHSFLSFGQKRMLAFLWACQVDRYQPIVADELVNGLHHEWLELVMNEKLATRQSFLATQNPLLLDYIPIENAEDAKHKFVRCTLEPDANGRETMCWRNLNDDEATRLWSALEAGIQHVSEILRDEKLW